MNVLPDSFKEDIENGGDAKVFRKNAIEELLWRDITLTVKDKKTKEPKHLLKDVTGQVQSGTCLLPLENPQNSPISWSLI